MICGRPCCVSVAINLARAAKSSMAHLVALRRSCGASSFIFGPSHTLRSASVVTSTVRNFNTNLQRSRTFEGDDVDNEVDVNHRGGRNFFPRRDDFLPFFSDVFGPLSSTRSLSQLLNLVDQFDDNPYLAASRGMGAGGRRGWDVKEDSDALYLRMDMPGLTKEDVKISLEQDTLTIKGEGEKESDDDRNGRRYSSRIELPPNMFNAEGIKAEMKNGVLKVTVPKVKEEERRDVRHVRVD